MASLRPLSADPPAAPPSSSPALSIAFELAIAVETHACRSAEKRLSQSPTSSEMLATLACSTSVRVRQSSSTRWMPAMVSE